MTTLAIGTRQLRWDLAIELYVNGQISTGRAAQIAELNYFVFMEQLNEHGIPFMGAEPAIGEKRKKEEALLNELFDFSQI